MAWILERYRTAAVWPTGTRDTGDAHPLTHFIEVVDRLFYAAAVVFAVSIIALIVK
ncbi:MAG TPA: hypothetical protein VED01_16810 [Burkholderiales bacterium]|nr:hypothetical protein [Burkholderiales bacterium]